MSNTHPAAAKALLGPMPQTRLPWPSLAVALTLSLWGLLLPATGMAATYMVTNLNDAGAGSLRRAMNDAVNHPGPDVIEFDSALSGVITILSALPDIGGVAGSAGTEIHGETADITIDGAGGGFDCFRVATFANDCVIRGLTVRGCVNGLVVFGDAIDGPFNLLVGGANLGHRMFLRENVNGLRLGGDLNGMTVVNTHAITNSGSGLLLTDGGRELTVGGPADFEYCVFSGNGAHGILMDATDGTITMNTLRNSRIGVGSDGFTAQPNTLNGIRMNTAAAGLINLNQVRDNTISGNLLDGVLLTGNVDGNTFAGNHIGTDIAGLVDVGNGWNGVRIQGGAQYNRFQHPLDSATGPNVVSGNFFSGFSITDVGTDQNVIDGCYIGVDATGAGILRNEQNGVVIFDNQPVGAQFNQIQRSVVSANGYNGIHLAEGSHYTHVASCMIGLDVTGCCMLPNGLIATMGGVAIGGVPGGNPGVGGGSTFNLITMNAIGGHTNFTDHFGVGIFCTSHDNTVSSNKIGIDPTGSAPRPNQYGVYISSADANLVDGNQISWNVSHGVVSRGNDNTFIRNAIGSDPAGIVPAQGNGGSGIYVTADGNVIGGLRSLGYGNRIADNMMWGIEAHSGAGVFPNLEIRGNDIGLSVLGTAQGNRRGGVWLGHAYRACVVGDDITLTLGADASNVIAYNGGDPTTAQAGVLVGEADTGPEELNDPYGNVILSNSIYENAGEGITIDYNAGDEGNRNVSEPSVATAQPDLVEGSTNLPALPVPIVQVFSDSWDEGRTYLGEATVTGTTWSYTPTPSLAGSGLKVTATNTVTIAGLNHTSEFSDEMDVTVPASVVLTGAELPDMGGISIPRAFSKSPDDDGVAIGGEIRAPGDSVFRAAVWEGTLSTANFTATILPATPGMAGRVNAIALVGSAGIAAIAGGQTGEEAAPVPAVWKRTDSGIWSILPVPSPCGNGGGTVNSIVVTPGATGSTLQAVGWSRCSGGPVTPRSAIVWLELENGGLITGTTLPVADSNGPSEALDVAAESGTTFAVGFHSSNAASVPALWSNVNPGVANWVREELPLPAGAASGTASHIVGRSSGLLIAGQYQTPTGRMRGILWMSTDGGGWTYLSLPALAGFQHCRANDLAASGSEILLCGLSYDDVGNNQATLWVLGSDEPWEVGPITVAGSDATLAEATAMEIVEGAIRITGWGTSGTGGDQQALLLTAAGTSSVEAPQVTSVSEGRVALRASANPVLRNDGVTFTTTLPASEHASLAIYDVSGRRVRQVHDGVLPAGSHSLAWDGRDGTGTSVAPGTYFAVFSTRSDRRTAKLTIVR